MLQYKDKRRNSLCSKYANEFTILCADYENPIEAEKHIAEQVRRARELGMKGDYFMGGIDA